MKIKTGMLIQHLYHHDLLGDKINIVLICDSLFFLTTLLVIYTQYRPMGDDKGLVVIVSDRESGL